MKRGKIKILPEALQSVLKLPVDWQIISLHKEEHDRYITAVISGNDFPEVEKGTEPKECEIIVSDIKFEVTY